MPNAKPEFIPYGRQHITPADIDAVVAVLTSDFLTQGQRVPEFERALASRVGANYGVAVNSATSALHIACLALGLGVGDWLWTTPNTFVASANCGVYCGAQVDFVDIDPVTRNLSVDALATKLAQAARDHRLPEVVVVVHFAGEPCDMAAIGALAKQYGFAVIEDASHAVGAQYRGAPVGNCQYSDITVFSFHPVKIITTAEGGLATTNREDLAAHMLRLRSHGITRDSAHMVGKSDGTWYYQQLELGFNYRMTELQAALGLSQLDKLQAFITRRQTLAQRYDDKLADLVTAFGVRLPHRDSRNVSALHLYPIQVAPNVRRAVFDTLRAHDIGVNVHYIPVHTQPYYRALGFEVGDFPHAEAYYAGAISLPLYYDLTDAQQDRVIATLKDALNHATKQATSAS